MLTKDDLEHIGEIVGRHVSGVRKDVGLSIGRLQLQVAGIDNGLTAVRDELNGRMDSLDKKVDILGARVDRLDQKVDALSNRVDGLDKKVDSLDKKIDESANDVIEQISGFLQDEILPAVSEKHKELDKRIAHIEDHLDLPSPGHT